MPDEIMTTSSEAGFGLMDHIPMGIFIISTEMKIKYWNSWLERYTGIKRAEVLGRTLTDVYPHLLAPKYMERIQAILEGAPPTIFSSLLHKYFIPVKQKNGNFRTQNTTVVPIPSQTGETDVLFAVDDVTDLNNRINESQAMRDRALDAKKQAEEATKLKDRFVALVSHDLKNPLTSILGFLQIINNELESLSKSDIKYMIQVAMESGENMKQLIDDVLDISRIRSGKMAMNQKFIDAAAVVKKSLFPLQPLADKKNVEISVLVPPKTRIYCDAILMEQVVQNLVSNAIKFCNGGDKITISIPRGAGSVISVADTGAGINPENLPNIFSHEIKTSTQGTAGEMGTGFGLPLSRDIMEAHGGTLTVKTEVGKGTEFFAGLPDVKPKVLLVDDDRLTREIIKKILEGLDLKIIEAEGANQALAAVQKEMPHLVLTDLNMPGLSGFDLINELRKNAATASLPIIAITSDSSIGPREKAMQLGADDFVLKSSDSDDIIFRVARHVSC